MDIRKFLKRTEPATTSTAVNSSSGSIDESTLLSDSEIMQEDTEFVNVQKDIKITSSTCQSSKSYRRLIKPEYLDTYGIADVKGNAVCVLCATRLFPTVRCAIRSWSVT